VDANFVTSDLVKFAHEKKLIVNTWTVNEKSQKDELIELGVDQITGNVVF
jgi:glycerophosphoryl diester phosphodiesterase